jgi:hypothetical protein
MKLQEIQKTLKAPKNQRNSFGNYNYRSCEDILEAVKPLLGDSVLTISDEIVNVGTRYYVKAVVKFTDDTGKEYISTAYAREAENKKGMDDAQITGACSSYARKYALNGMFLIDDTKDADTMNNTSLPEKKTAIDDSISSLILKYGMPNELKGWESFSQEKKIKALEWFNNQIKENTNGK